MDLSGVKKMILVLRTSIQSVYENLLLKLGMIHSSRTKKRQSFHWVMLIDEPQKVQYDMFSSCSAVH